MINDRIIHLQALRIYLINFCVCSPCNWDLKKKRMKASEYPAFWNYYLVIAGASLYTLTVLYRIYTNSVIVFGGYDEEKVYLVSKSGKRILATLIFLTIDSLAVAFITNAIGIAILLAERRQMMWRINNAVLDLNTTMLSKFKTSHYSKVKYLNIFLSLKIRTTGAPQWIPAHGSRRQWSSG